MPTGNRISAVLEPDSHSPAMMNGSEQAAAARSDRSRSAESEKSASSRNNAPAAFTSGKVLLTRIDRNTSVMAPQKGGCLRASSAARFMLSAATAATPSIRARVTRRPSSP